MILKPTSTQKSVVKVQLTMLNQSGGLAGEGCRMRRRDTSVSTATKRELRKISSATVMVKAWLPVILVSQFCGILSGRRTVPDQFSMAKTQGLARLLRICEMYHSLTS